MKSEEWRYPPHMVISSISLQRKRTWKKVFWAMLFLLLIVGMMKIWLNALHLRYPAWRILCLLQLVVLAEKVIHILEGEFYALKVWTLVISVISLPLRMKYIWMDASVGNWYDIFLVRIQYTIQVGRLVKLYCDTCTIDALSTCGCLILMLRCEK